jgi:hypothetical protein
MGAFGAGASGETDALAGVPAEGLIPPWRKASEDNKTSFEEGVRELERSYFIVWPGGRVGTRVTDGRPLPVRGGGGRAGCVF